MKKCKIRVTDKAVRVDGHDIGDACIAVRISRDANFAEAQIDLDGTDIVFDLEVDQFKVNNIYMPKMLDNSFEDAMVKLLEGRGYLITKDENYTPGTEIKTLEELHDEEHGDKND